MYIYFDSNGVLREIINDKAVRQGDLNANEVLVYIENVEPADIWITFRKPGGAFSTEKSFITNKITKEIPYNKNRDMRYFKDLTEYTFYKFVISDEITEAGTYEATIRFTYADSLVALGKFVFNAEPSVIKQDNLITQAQYNYLIWYVGSWQGQIGNLASGIATLNSEITTIKSRLDTNEANITNLLSNYVKKTSLTTNSSQSIKPVVNGDFITFEIRNLQSSDNLIKTDNENGIYVSANGVISLVSARIVSDSNLRNAIKGVVYEVGTTKDWQSGTQVNSKITTHDENTTAHAYLRGLINDISQEIARIDARGRSYGELDKTLSELLLESDKDLYIYNYLTNKYSGYENQVGNLIYTKVSDNEPEHELEYNGTNWVDNGAYLISKADNTQFGMVKGDNEYISILNGLIQVLKSDYATRLGTSGANYTYSDLLNTLTQFATDIYKKNETYSATQIEQRITDLLGMMNLQDTAIEFSPSDYELDYNGTVVSTFPATLVNDYNWVFVRVLVGTQAEYTMFKPSVSTTGVGIDLPLIQKDVFAQIKRVSGDFEFALYKKADNTLSPTTASVRMWGIKLDGINTGEITHKTTETLEHYLDNLDSDQVYFNRGLEDIENLVVNGDFSNGTTGWLTANPVGIPLTVNNNILSFTATQQFSTAFFDFTPTINEEYYFSAYVKTDSKSVGLHNRFATSQLVVSDDSGFGTFAYISSLTTATSTQTQSFRISDYRSSGWTETQVKNVVLYNVSTMKLKGIKNDDGILFNDLTNEEIKVQLDTWVQNGTLGKQTLREKFTEIEQRITDLLGLANLQDINLLDYQKVLMNSFIAQDGTVQSATGYFITDYIPIEAGAMYIWKYPEVDKGAYYNYKKDYSSVITSDCVSAGDFTILTVPSGTVGFVRFNSRTVYTPLSSAMVVKTPNYFDSTKATQNSYVGGDGSISSATGYYISDYIPVKKGETYIWKYEEGGRGGYYDESKDFIHAIDLTNSTLTASGYIVFTVPDNDSIKYIRCNFRTTYVAIASAKIYSYPNYEKYNPKLEGITVSDKDWQKINNLIDEKSVDTNIYKSVNLLDSNADGVITGHYLNPNGTQGDLASGNISDFIEIDPTKSYMITVAAGFFGSGNVNVQFYDENKDRVGAITDSTSGASVVEFTSEDYGTYNVLITGVVGIATAKYMQVSFFNANFMPYSNGETKYQVVEGSLIDEFPSTYQPYYYNRVLGEDFGLNDNQKEEVEKIAGVSPLYGKSVVFDGDSICHATSAGQTDGGWAKRIGEANGMNWWNKGISGGTIARLAGHDTGIHIISENFENYPEELDYVIIEGGTNDADIIANDTSLSVGTFSENDFSGNYDNGTFCGAMEYMLYNLIQKYPSAKIGYIVAQKMGYSGQGHNSNYGNGNARYDIFVKAMAICKKWGVSFVNLWDGSHMNPMLSAQFARTGSQPDTALYTDGQHLTSKGYDYLAPIIEAWMKTL